MNEFLILALVAPVLWAISNIIDKYLLSRKLKNPFSYDIITIWIGVIFIIAIPAFVKISFSFNAYFYGILIGIIFCGIYLLYDKAMGREEGSRVVSLIYTMPLYVALLSRLFLGESLSIWNYLGIVLLAVSAVIVSYRGMRKKHLLSMGMIMMLLYAIIAAATRVLSKSVIASVPPLSYVFWIFVGQTIGSLLLLFIPRIRKHLKSDLKTVRGNTFWLLIGTAIFDGLGLLAFYVAIALGSVSIASGISALQPFFFLVGAFVVAKIFPHMIKEDLDGYAIELKILAIVFLVVGTLLVIG